ncbi:ABC transporter ATP-binding protein [Corynebacterium stationis]|uniref:ABC transporter ATP-binding protein n=1 Tax=Corynebacterium stationis TaxID=1705 RepID=UPI00174F8009|nr:ABC transporter ATP-binding protein [Corynebacterium stationis]
MTAMNINEHASTAQQLDSTALHVKDLSVGYGERTVLDTLNVDIKRGAVTSIVGPNGCGKSTLLRTMSRLLNPTKGEIVLDGKSIHDIPTRKLATQLGLLPQTPIAPDGIVVADLVGRGRTPHQGILGRWSQQDYDIVAEALETTGISDLAERSIDELSGGQRQRVWIAMALAQRTDTLLLDEPTTYLDVKHQLDVLDLLTELNRDRGTTIVMVLHDLNLAARYSDELVAVSGGKVFAHGHPREVITKENVKSVFGIDSVIITDPVSDQPAVMPIGRHHLRNK